MKSNTKDATKRKSMDNEAKERTRARKTVECISSSHLGHETYYLLKVLMN